MDAGERKVLEDVASHGWHVIKVFEDDKGPGFAYTIGLFANYGHPEIIAFGLPLERLHALLNLVGDDAKAGVQFRAGDTSDELLNGYPCTFIEFPKAEFPEYLGFATWFYKGRPFPALQLVWPDKDERWPWDPAVDPEIRLLQPTPGWQNNQ
jgi:hypothetical protein